MTDEACEYARHHKPVALLCAVVCDVDAVGTCARRSCDTVVVQRLYKSPSWQHDLKAGTIPAGADLRCSHAWLPFVKYLRSWTYGFHRIA